MRFRFTLIAVAVAAVVLLTARANVSQVPAHSSDSAAADAPVQTELPQAALQAASGAPSPAGAFLADCVAAMETAGETHTVLILSGIDESGLQELFPELTVISLGDKTAYEVSQERANLAETAGEITVAVSQVLETGTEDPVWMFILE